MTDTIRASPDWVLQQSIHRGRGHRLIGASRHQSTEGRITQRNGLRARVLSTPAAEVDLGIPKLREGSLSSAARGSGEGTSTGPCTRW